MVLGGQPPGRVGRRRIFFLGPRRGPFFWSEVQRPQPADPLRDGRVSREQRTEVTFLEGIDHVQRPRGRVPDEGDKVGGLVEAQSSAAIRSAANSRRGERRACTIVEATGPRTKRSARSNQPPRRLSSSS